MFRDRWPRGRLACRLPSWPLHGHAQNRAKGLPPMPRAGVEAAQRDGICAVMCVLCAENPCSVRSAEAGEDAAEVVEQAPGACFAALNSVESVEMDALFGVGEPRPF
jgi:hypothetical protein